MELPTGNVHVLRAPSRFKPLKLTPKSGGMIGLNARPGSLEEEAFDTFVAEAHYHTTIVS
jgi:hypothetical protein